MSFILRLLKSMTLILLSIDSKIKIILADSCWFNSVNDLVEIDITPTSCTENLITQKWSLLWDCAGQALCSGFRQSCEMKRYAHRQFPQVLLCSRKRDELTFSFRISSLHQLVVCRHASGADSDRVVNNQICLSQSTMRALAIVLFLLPESTRRMRYVHCLCCCLLNGRSPDYPALRGKEKDCVHNMTVAWRGNKTWVPYVELG
ncbi:oligogalacturonate-specific porin KdgM family protein [Citrobacter braakii]|uniref:oligogalacturonate-specific porin KdgM family protein n=1 Tax=Citrobacter braakii TaxID=57706 RepID=UPI001F22732C|nr:oligogalacturonate-specific porin KdgM family protein [Citrobacter braakii]